MQPNRPKLMSALIRNSYLFLIGVTLILLIFVVAALHLSSAVLDWPAILVFAATLLGTFITLLSFDQKQSLEEFKVFRELFAEFNERDDDLNEDLNRICSEDPEEELSPKDRTTLYDYFNLCGEEYFYFKLRYIYPEVWRTWCHGIEGYLKYSRVGKLWAEEERTDSYYGLTREVIAKHLNQ